MSYTEHTCVTSTQIKKKTEYLISILGSLYILHCVFHWDNWELNEVFISADKSPGHILYLFKYWVDIRK